MASNKLGITHCPECGHHKADIKISTESESKKPYRHCPECYASYHPRNKHQVDMLLAKMKASDEPNTLPKPVEPAPTVAPAAPAAPAKEETEYEMVFGVRVPKKKVTA